MDEKYDPWKIEKKQQARWRETRAFETEKNHKPKFYCLEMLPYPSGSLHMGHVRNYSIGDAIARYKRLCGFNVLHPIGWDSFGQPAEQAAIKRGIDPRDWTEANIAHMRGQLYRLGFSYDWRREIAAHNPGYYKWDQWFFLKMFERGLVYKKFAPVNWCPNEETVLSNEQSSGGICWRCETPVIQRELEQWFIRSSNYSDELIADMREIEQDWPERVLQMQRNWIKNLRDWGISRQRFWGAPIPIVYCDKCSIAPVPEKDLPVMLPPSANFTGKGGSPLATAEEFVNAVCPNCGGAARRETDTMDTFVDSSWYFFRYCDPKNEDAPFDKDEAAYWIPVDLYVGGIDHAVMHLLYTRIWTKIMRDIGLIAFNEPVKRLLTQGMVTNIVEETGQWKAMSKSLGNGVDPDKMIDSYGADAVRMFTLFAAPPEHEQRWREDGIIGIVRFLRRVYAFANRWSSRLIDSSKAEVQNASFSRAALSLRRKTHRTIERVTEDFEKMRFNTAIAALMELMNALRDFETASQSVSDSDVFVVREALESLILMSSPMSPHFAEEMWECLGHDESISSGEVPWPKAE